MPDEKTPPEPLKIEVSGDIKLTGALGLRKISPTDSEAVRVVEEGWTAGADRDGGSINQAASQGRPSQGEAESLACARRFVQFLRTERGETWWDEPVDADLKSAARPARSGAAGHGDAALELVGDDGARDTAEEDQRTLVAGEPVGHLLA